jgi:hypothetical protein
LFADTQSRRTITIPKTAVMTADAGGDAGDQPEQQPVRRLVSMSRPT